MRSRSRDVPHSVETLWEFSKWCSRYPSPLGPWYKLGDSFIWVHICHFYLGGRCTLRGLTMRPQSYGSEAQLCLEFGTSSLGSSHSTPTTLSLF